jgi:hypothetical protein
MTLPTSATLGDHVDIRQRGNMSGHQAPLPADDDGVRVGVPLERQPAVCLVRLLARLCVLLQ